MQLTVVNHEAWVWTFATSSNGMNTSESAKTAVRLFGASKQLSEGHSSQSFAIPILDNRGGLLPSIDAIAAVEQFLEYAHAHSDTQFYIDRLGFTQLGANESTIAALFHNAPSNVLIPRAWQNMKQNCERFRLIVAGSRGVTDYDRLATSLDIMLRNKATSHAIEIVSGGARGVDLLGERYAAERGYHCTRIPAQWRRFGKPAGYLRNGLMACYSDALLALWDGKSPGTKSMVEIAKQHAMPSRILRA